MAIVTINKVDLFNKALSLVGDYNLSVGADSTVNSLYTSVDTTFRAALYKIFTDLRSVNNYSEVVLTGASLVGNFYRYTLPTTTKLIRPHLIINNKNGQTLNFTTLADRARGNTIHIEGSTVLVINKDFISSTPLADITFAYFWQPVIDGAYNASTLVTIDETVLEVLCMQVASMLAVFLGNDLNLSQLLDNNSRELLAVVKTNQGMDYGRPYFAGISMPTSRRY
jgi:hypothetical protein